MTTVYKLTEPDMTTYNGYQWELGEPRMFPGKGELCTEGWAHAYTSPGLALFLNPIHAKYTQVRLFQATGIVGATDHGLKVGCSKVTLIRELQVPVLTLEQRATFAVYAAMAVYTVGPWVDWALNWLDGSDRSVAAADAAANAAGTATYISVAAVYAAHAFYAAARAAATAKFVADNDDAAAYYAADSAYYAAHASPVLNLDAIAAACLLPWEWE